MEVRLTRFLNRLKFPHICLEMMSALGRWPYVADLVVLGWFLGWRHFQGLLEHPSPFAGCSKIFVRMGWDCREGVFNGFLPVLNPNGFMTGWWWVVITWRKTRWKFEREVSSQLLEHELSQQAVIVNHPCYRWVMRNDRLGNVGI